MSPSQSGAAGEIPDGSSGSSGVRRKAVTIDPGTYASATALNEAIGRAEAAGETINIKGVHEGHAQVTDDPSGRYQDLDPWPTKEWDPFVGCVPISPGCRECYGARRVSAMAPNHACVTRRDGIPVFTGHTFFARSKVELPLTLIEPAIIFYCAHCDPLQPLIEVERTVECFGVMREARQHQFNILTKYSHRLGPVMKRVGQLPPNVRLGISAEDQKHLDERWEDLKQIEAPMYILSLEPILEAITIPKDFHNGWVVAMAEVGKQPRSAKPEWFASLREQCRALGVPFFWETTAHDGRLLVEERIRANRAGDPYETQGFKWGLPVIESIGSVRRVPMPTPLPEAGTGLRGAVKRGLEWIARKL